MKKIAFLLICLFPFTSFLQAQDIDVLHYNFLLSLHDENDTIIGVTFITFARKAGVSTASFELAGVDKNGKGMKVANVTMSYQPEVMLPFSHSDGIITIQLPMSKALDTFDLSIAYRGSPSDGLIISKNKYGDRTFFADNWPDRAHHWIPCVDRPDDKASFEFLVAAPSYYNVISNGVKVEDSLFGNRRLVRWVEDTPQPTKVMVIGVAKFATKTFDDSPKDIPVSAWIYPQDSTKGFYNYALTPEIVKFFSNYIAPYPYKKLANVQSKTIFGGMENASAIFYAESSVTGDRSEEDLMAHEIAHQWFGDMASEKSFAHVWLSEGFATYFTNIYWEHKYGKEAMIKRLQKDREDVIAFAKTSTQSVVDSTKDLMSLLNANSYQKGGWVLHMLRAEVGDSTFQKIIQAYYNQYKGSNADTRDFEAVTEKVSGRELTWFFNQWLYQVGIPQLRLTQKSEGNDLIVTIEQLQPGEPYQFKLGYFINDQNGGSIDGNTFINDKISVRRWPGLGQMKSTFIIDPRTKLLFEEIKSR